MSEGEPCPNNASCKDETTCGACRNEVDTLCLENVFYICSSGTYSKSACSLGLGCHTEDKKGVCNDCNGDRCDNNSSEIGILKECMNGKYQEGKECKVNGEPVSCQSETECGKCRDGAEKCDNNSFGNGTLTKCVNGIYQDAKDCKVSGSAVSCLSETSCSECINDAVQCKDNMIQTCVSGKWVDSKKCTGDTPVCDAKANKCVAKSMNCQIGETKCSDHQIQTCDNGEWKTEICQLGCYDSTQCNSCPMNYKECKGSTLRTCLGISWKEETCEFTCEGVNGNAKCKCKPGVIYCVYTTGAQRCKEDGTWEDMSCPGGCTGGKCLL